jgi:tetratricopeptide (TPR) repeat protein
MTTRLFQKRSLSWLEIGAAALIGIIAVIAAASLYRKNDSQRPDDKNPTASSAANSDNSSLRNDNSISPRADATPRSQSSVRNFEPGQMQAEVAAALDTARKEPNNFEAQVKAAELYYQIQRYDDAIGYLLKANQLKPDDFETIANLGMVNIDAGHYETSVKWYKAAQLKKPEDTRVQAGLCAALLGQGDAKAAEAEINKLEKLDSNNQDLAQFRERLASLKSGGKSK